MVGSRRECPRGPGGSPFGLFRARIQTLKKLQSYFRFRATTHVFPAVLLVGRNETKFLSVKWVPIAIDLAIFEAS
jgi:hypothetical protein